MEIKKEKKPLKKNANKKQVKSEVKNAETSNTTAEKTKKNIQQIKKSKPKKNLKKFKKSQPASYKNVPNIIPNSYPNDLVVVINNLPNKCKQSDIISAFTRFGSITYVQKAGNKASIGFLELEEANAAKEAGKVLVRGQKVLIKARNKKQHPTVDSAELNVQKDELWYRTIFIFHIDPTTTEDDIRKHFELCGKIDAIKHFKTKFNPHFKVIFKENSEAEEALKLHNTVLKENVIHVRRKSNQPVAWDLKRTIVLLNPNGLTKIDGSKIVKLFKECGEIEKCDVFCYKNRLAMISFKHEESIEKVLSLNGTKKHGIQIDVELYSTKFQKQAIPFQNNKQALLELLEKCKKSKVCIEKVAEALTEKDIANIFKTCGAVKSVNIAEDRSAVVEFENTEGYCKAFSLHESVFGGRKLILKPYTEQEIPDSEKIKKQKGKRNLNDNVDNTNLSNKLRKKA